MRNPLSLLISPCCLFGCATGCTHRIFTDYSVLTNSGAFLALPVQQQPRVGGGLPQVFTHPLTLAPPLPPLNRWSITSCLVAVTLPLCLYWKCLLCCFASVKVQFDGKPCMCCTTFVPTVPNKYPGGHNHVLLLCPGLLQDKIHVLHDLFDLQKTGNLTHVHASHTLPACLFCTSTLTS